MEKQNILIADDHEVIRDGIQIALQQHDLTDNIYEAENGDEALEQCRDHANIDLVLLDISMPDMDGIEAAQQIKDQFPDVEIIALSMLNDEESIRNMLKAGASGYVLKSAGRADIIEAIEKVSQGKPFYSEEVTFKVMKHYSNPESTKTIDQDSDLTEREIEILQLIVNEYTNQEIADKLYISKRTVDTHRTNLLQKTNSKNTAGLVRYALNHDLA